MMVCVNCQSVSIATHLGDGPPAMPVRGYLGYGNGGQRIHSSGGRQDFPGLGPGCHKKAKLAGRQQSCPLLPDCEHKLSHAPATSPAHKL